MKIVKTFINVEKKNELVSSFVTHFYYLSDYRQILVLMIAYRQVIHGHNNCRSFCPIMGNSGFFLKRRRSKKTREEHEQWHVKGMNQFACNPHKYF